MHNMDAKNCLTASRLLPRLFHGNFPSNKQVKSCIALCSAIFDQMGKNDS